MLYKEVAYNTKLPSTDIAFGEECTSVHIMSESTAKTPYDERQNVCLPTQLLVDGKPFFFWVWRGESDLEHRSVLCYIRTPPTLSTSLV